MIVKFLDEGKYRHYKFKDAYIHVIKATEYDDHYMIDVMWKCQRTDRLFWEVPQKLSVPKTLMREWDTWPSK